MAQENERTRKNIFSSLTTRAILLLFVLILPFNFLGIATALRSYRGSVRQVELMAGSTMDSYLQIVKNRMSNTESMVYSLMQRNADFLALASSSDDSRRQAARYHLYTAIPQQMNVSDVAQSIFFYFVSRDDYLEFPYLSADTAGTRPFEPYLQDADAYSRWRLVQHGDEPCLVRILHDRGLNVLFGYCIRLTPILQALGKSHQGTASFAFEEGSFPDIRETGDAIYLSRSLQEDICLTARLDRADLAASIGNTPVMALVVMCLYLLLVPILIVLLRRGILLPLGRLNIAHAALESGDEDYRIREKSSTSQFQTAYDSFNRMADALKTLRHEVVAKEVANKQLMIDYLQLQIRPHFLLNSFNVLFTLVQTGKREAAQEMILFLSDYFRYMFRKGAELELFSKELRLIENYLKVAGISYPDAFSVSFQVDPVITLMRVPPLLIYNFVENIIQHALVPGRMVHIVFAGSYEDGFVTIDISDDGSGIAPEALSQIREASAFPADQGSNIGIRNAIRRLLYYYGDEASVDVESQLGVGTTFTIRIPYNLEEDAAETAVPVSSPEVSS